MTVAVLHPQTNIFPMPSTFTPIMQSMSKPSSSSLQSIAPRNDPEPAGAEGGNVQTSGTQRPINVPRARLPPRSRFGCWTCRNRKVKCDEARPECTPCVRLGHTCDYNPRLSIKDDTPRVIQKISGRGGGVGPVWKPAERPPKRQRLDLGQLDFFSSHPQLSQDESMDSLAPFPFLTNDEEREKKASFKPPGTYNVIVNQNSFVNFNEYKETFPGDPYPPVVSNYGGPPANRVDSTSYKTRQSSPLHSYYSHESSEGLNDADVVILKVFEDNDADMLSPAGYRQARSSRSNTISNATTSMAASIPSNFGAPLSAQRGDIFNYSVDNTPLLRYAHHDGQDHSIIYYYKNFVHRHLAQVHRDTLGTSVETGALTAPDVMERQAGTFLPVSV